MEETENRQRLHLVMGGRVKDPRTMEFQDPESIHVVGVFSSYDAAAEAWRANAQRTVDDAEMKYVVVHIHHLLTPGA
ncbi:MAG: inositol monophosphatase [Erythrobacter sp. RIFCSPHIGHO2_12_FULL_63_10]|nr:MAG: inositol monophosphatase [Erythrobacter sp. RIFCSPHIGHO2_12_FULL_63_10]